MVVGNLAVKPGTYLGHDQSAAIELPLQPTRPSLKTRLLLCLLLFSLSTAVLLAGFRSLAPAPDEMHWVSRSANVLMRAKQHRFEHLTTHLPHPGIPGSFVMAVGQWAAVKWNQTLGLGEGATWYLDELSASRFAAVSAAGCFAPLVFLLALPLLGTRISLVAATLFALDPYFLAVGRQAHIDASLALAMCISALLFINGVRRDSLLFQLGASLFFGLALASKPTAVLLLPSFALIRLCNRALGFSNRIFYWRDLWSVVIGFSLFSLLYTRLWYRWSVEAFKLNPWRGADTWADALAPFAAKYYLFAVPLGLLGFIILCFGKSQSKTRLAAAHLSLLLALLSLVLAWRPELLRNLTGYAGWVLGLAETPHYAYGRVWEPAPYGYPALLFEKAPSLMLLGVILALPLLVFHATRRQRMVVLSLLAVTVCVAGGLNVSSKQAYRYLLPVLPMLYLMGTFGILHCTFGLHRSAASFVGALLVLVQGFSLYQWREAPQLFHNVISGGLPAAFERGSAHSFAGQNTVIEWLQARSAAEGRALKVGVIGDFQALQSGYLRLYPAATRTDNSSVRFQNYSDYDPGEYTVVFRSMLSRMDRDRDDLSFSKPVLTIREHGVDLAWIFPAEPLQDERSFDVARLPRRTGSLVSAVEGVPEYLRALPETNPRDYLFYNTFLQLNPGRYCVRLEHQPQESLAELDPARFAIRLHLSSMCERIFAVEELSQSTLVFSCEFDRPLYAQLRAYWFGYAPMLLQRVQVSRCD